MSKLNTDPTEQPSSGEFVNTSRRKLTGAMLVGPVVYGSLASKQALGATIPYHCTVSGQISIAATNSVRPGATAVDCGDLGRSPEFWAERTSCWSDVAGLSFSGTFGKGPNASIGAVMAGCVGTEEDRAAAASYLNAIHFHTRNPAYPLDPTQVVTLFGNPPVGFVVLNYFKGLYENDSRTDFDCNTVASFVCPT